MGMMRPISCNLSMAKKEAIVASTIYGSSCLVVQSLCGTASRAWNTSMDTKKKCLYFSIMFFPVT